MIPPNAACARALRDGGIDAMAALDFAMPAALNGLSPEQDQELKLVFARLMAHVVEQFINPAIRAYPELAPDRETWAAIVEERAALRSKRSAADSAQAPQGGQAG
ncbi:hypothetical protein [Massilia consociata]|uniref:Uncharacterized protein n=1 Tax=Massilia consociata TaxID=760117 RepID=A0ABV6FF11_9BURK